MLITGTPEFIYFSEVENEDGTFSLNPLDSILDIDIRSRWSVITQTKSGSAVLTSFVGIDCRMNRFPPDLLPLVYSTIIYSNNYEVELYNYPSRFMARAAHFEYVMKHGGPLNPMHLVDLYF